MKLYKYITGPDDEQFCMRVSEALNKGWKLYGSPSLTFDGTTPIAGQALTKKIPGKEFNQQLDLKSY